MAAIPTASPPVTTERLSRWQRRTVWACVVVGALARALYVFVLHPEVDHVYSDMEGYVHRALAWAAFGGAAETIADTVYPPGPTIYFGLLARADPAWRVAAIAQWAVSLGIIGLVWSIARRLYGNATAVVALVAASIYLPLIHYAGLFLAENPFTLAGLASFRWFLAATDAKDLAPATGWAMLAGLAAGLAASLKGTVLAPVVVVGVAWVALALRQRRPHSAGVVIGALAGAALVMLPLAQRCTNLVRTQVCLGSTNAAMNVLMGHYGEVGPFYWYDDARNSWWTFQTPSAVLHGYTARADLPFPPYDEPANLALAKEWIRAHPWQALGASVEHVADLVAGRTLWPAAELWGVDWGAVWQWLFWVFVLPPALARIAVKLPSMMRLDASSAAEVLLVAPLAGLAATAFLTIGEVRYRIPFDAFFIILAARGYVALWSFRRGGRAPPGGATDQCGELAASNVEIGAVQNLVRDGAPDTTGFVQAREPRGRRADADRLSHGSRPRGRAVPRASRERPPRECRSVSSARCLRA